MDIEFGRGDDLFSPMYEDIDWRALYLSQYPPTPGVWAEVTDELGLFQEQLTQQNCCFYLNATAPEFDVMVVIDHRDSEGDWWFSRGQMGDELFNEMLDEIGQDVMVVHTKYPPQRVAEFVMGATVTSVNNEIEGMLGE